MRRHEGNGDVPLSDENPILSAGPNSVLSPRPEPFDDNQEQSQDGVEESSPPSQESSGR